VTKRLFVVVAVLGLTGVSLFAQSKATIQGVWRVVEVTPTGPNATINTSPQPGFYIFTAKHFSIIRDASPKGRQPVKDIAKLTGEEALATYGPFQARAGTYEVTGSTINMTVQVAKNPPHGRKEVDSFKIEGDTLWITQMTGATGKVANPTTIRLTRVE
jgi:hypothetical protein